jgi:hypothetical protein
MTYAIVSDVPASWEAYEPLRLARTNPIPSGLLIHVAGPTDEGFRLIDVWATRADWERFAPLDGASAGHTPAPAIVRELHAAATIRTATICGDES